ncbi:protein kinase [Mariniblastus sp.]|nr:protein kinase [Mariniblastus sp.]
MAESAKKVLQEVTAAGLLSSDHVTDYSKEIDTGADALISKLIKDGCVTEYQAEKFRTGQSSEIYFGDYIVIDKLGQGGMGTVLLAKHRRMDRKVAIKVLPVTALESTDAVARFYQEVKVAARLNHPSVVHAYDAGEHRGFHYLVMEYVEGHDLSKVLSQLGIIPAPLALDYISQVASGLEYAHRKGVIHRDIKPSNLLLDYEGQVKILDMGLARIADTVDQQLSTQLTTTGQMMGTVEYMSPEQAEDTRSADERSDIYSLGCTMYRLMTGQSPFSRETIVKTILAHRSAAIPTINTGCDNETTINQLFQKMVAKKPEQRFQTVTNLLEAIRQLEDEELSSFEMTMTTSSDSIKDIAVATHWDHRSDPGGLPEAIVPDDEIEIIEDVQVIAPPVVNTTRPEVFYVGNSRDANALLIEFWAILIKDQSNRCLLFSCLSCVTALIPVLGIIVSWLSWRSAKRLVKAKKSGSRPELKVHRLKGAKLISILSFVAAIVGTLVFGLIQN